MPIPVGSGPRSRTAAINVQTFDEPMSSTYNVFFLTPHNTCSLALSSSFILTMTWFLNLEIDTNCLRILLVDLRLELKVFDPALTKLGGTEIDHQRIARRNDRNLLDIVDVHF